MCFQRAAVDSTAAFCVLLEFINKGVLYMTEQAKRARNAYLQAWRRQHPEQVRSYNKKWRDKNPEKVRQAKERYWERQAVKERNFLPLEEGDVR